MVKINNITPLPTIPPNRIVSRFVTLPGKYNKTILKNVFESQNIELSMPAP